MDDRLDVVQVPIPSAAPPGAGQCLGVAARENRLHEAIADHRDSGSRGLACECLVEKGGGSAAQLRLGQRQQANDPHATRKRVGDAREGHPIGGPGQQEPAGARVSVHSGLDCQDKLRRTLDLVDDRPVETANETNGIGRRSVEHGGIVERDERDIVARDPLRQRGLAGLPGAGQQHDPGIRQGFPDPFFDMARVHVAVSQR